MSSQKYLCTLLDHDNQKILGFCLFGTCQKVPFCFKCYQLSNDNSASDGHQGHLNFCVQFQSIASMLDRYIKSLTQDDKYLEIMTKNLSQFQSRILKSFTHKNKELQITTKTIIPKLQGFQDVIKRMIIVSTELQNELKSKNYAYLINNIQTLKKLFSKYGTNEIPTRIQRFFNQIKYDTCKNIQIEKIQFSIQKCACIYFENGKKLFESEKYKMALAQFDRAILMGNQMIETIYYKAQALNKLVEQYAGLDFIKLKQKNCQELIKFFKEAAQHYEQCFKVYSHAKSNQMREAAILQYQKRVSKAIQVCENPYELGYEAILCNEAQIEINPNKYLDDEAKAKALIEQEKYHEAILSYDSDIKRFPKLWEIYEQKAQYLIQLQKYDQAILCYNAYNKIAPNEYYSYQANAKILILQRKYDEAIVCYDAYIKIYPNKYQAYYDKADALIEYKKYNEAILCYDAYIKINPNLWETYARKAIALNQLEKEDQAILCLDAYIKICPNYCLAYEVKAIVLIQQKKYDEIILCFDEYIKKESNNYKVYGEKAAVLMKQQKYNQAIKCYDASIKLHPNQYCIYLGKAKALIEQQKYDEAIQCCDQFFKHQVPRFIKECHNTIIQLKAQALSNSQKYLDSLICLEKAELMGANKITKNNQALPEFYSIKYSNLVSLNIYDQAILLRRIDPYQTDKSGQWNQNQENDSQIYKLKNIDVQQICFCSIFLNFC